MSHDWTESPLTRAADQERRARDAALREQLASERDAARISWNQSWCMKVVTDVDRACASSLCRRGLYARGFLDATKRPRV